jgi:hypothetical protein
MRHYESKGKEESGLKPYPISRCNLKVDTWSALSGSVLAIQQGRCT